MADQQGPHHSGGHNSGGYYGAGRRSDRSGSSHHGGPADANQGRNSAGGYGSGGQNPGQGGGQGGGRPPRQNTGFGGGGRAGGNRPSPGRPGGFPSGGRPGGGRPGGFSGGSRPSGPRGLDMDRREAPRAPKLPKPEIVHKDNNILIVNKPAGIPVLHGASPTLCEMVEDLTGARRRRMRVAHMIDDECSGAVLFVAMRDTEDSPRDQTHPETSYLALVEGVFDEAAIRSGESVSAPVARSSGLGATPSSHIRIVDSGNGLSLVQVRARPDLPGQVREHLALIKHPVVGDQIHGSTRDDLHRVGLHALQIRITHPEDDKPQRYKAPAPASFWLAMGKEPPPDAQGLDLREAKDKEQGWDHVAGWYDNLISDRGSDHHQRVILPGITRLLDLNTGERVIDVACGQGVVSEHIVHETDVELVLGVDVSEKLISAANARATERTSYQVYDAQKLETLPAELAPFDAGVCVMALMNIDDLDAVMRGISAQLRPGGRFVCVISHPAFRITGGSAWGWAHDERTARPSQFRRVDHYMSPTNSHIVMNPGEVAQGKPAVTTVTHNRPMSAYINAAGKAGMMLSRCEEWISDRLSEQGPRANAENRARKEIPLFLALRFDKPPVEK